MHPTEDHGSVLTDVFGGHAQSYVGSGDAVTVWFIYIYIICFREEGQTYFEEAVTAP